jgi:FkbM family methyltransferase
MNLKKIPDYLKSRLPRKKTRSLTLPSANCVALAGLGFEHELNESGKNTFVVQIGACDGKEDDPIHKYLVGGSVQAVLVEPVPHAFKRLQETYGNFRNVRLVQAAVGRQDGEAIIYSVKMEGRWEKSTFAPMLSSFDRNHLLKHKILDHEIEATRVKTMTLKSLFRDYSIYKVNFMMIDTEGYDAEVVEMLLQGDVLPNKLCFEHIHLDQKSIDDLFLKLKDHGYTWIHDRQNTLILR